MPIRTGDMAVGLHEHRVSRQDVEDGKRKHDVRAIELHPMPRTPAAVMTNDMETIKAERLHQPDLIGSHGTDRIVRPVGCAFLLGRAAIAAQIGADHREIARKRRRHPCPCRETCGKLCKSRSGGP